MLRLIASLLSANIIAQLSAPVAPPPHLRLFDAQRPLMLAIAKAEGWGHPRSKVRRLHNPGALVFAHQPGASRWHGFAKFPTDAAGWQALRADNIAKQHRGLNTQEIARARCGPVDDCERYVKAVQDLMEGYDGEIR